MYFFPKLQTNIWVQFIARILFERLNFNLDLVKLQKDWTRKTYPLKKLKLHADGGTYALWLIAWIYNCYDCLPPAQTCLTVWHTSTPALDKEDGHFEGLIWKTTKSHNLKILELANKPTIKYI